ncbi:MAG TPA: HlyD family efflux transporter periplasmic adaptor subunit, partial [Paracoccaceae bacterium]|nr:HlyD family efflux transporter periplasmic adaptor subunit [Paracoccaceae bacterium]
VRATLAQAEWRLAQKRGAAPSDAVVIDTLFRPGEVAQAGQPIVQLLPPENIKLRFFVPEAHVARARIGTEIGFRCDGCGEGLRAAITYVAPRAEFTPPVIYSQSARAKLVFMVEAQPLAATEFLRPGLPVEVTALPEGPP